MCIAHRVHAPRMHGASTRSLTTAISFVRAGTVLKAIHTPIVPVRSADAYSLSNLTNTNVCAQRQIEMNATVIPVHITRTAPILKARTTALVRTATSVMASINALVRYQI